MELIHDFLASPYEAGGLVLDWPSVPPRTCVFVPLLVRDGGVLGAVPLGFLDASLVSAGQTGALDAVVGPSSEVELAVAEEEEDGSLRPVEDVCKALLVDFSLEVASYVARYDPVTSPVEAVPFVPARPDQQIAFPEALSPCLDCRRRGRTPRLLLCSRRGREPQPCPGQCGGAEETTGPQGQEAYECSAGRADRYPGGFDSRPDSADAGPFGSPDGPREEGGSAEPSFGGTPACSSPALPPLGFPVPPPNPLGSLSGFGGTRSRAHLRLLRRLRLSKSLVWTRRPESPFCQRTKVPLQRLCCSRAKPWGLW